MFASCIAYATAIPIAQAQECKDMGGTANTRTFTENKFVVAMTGDFDGGVYAEIVRSEPVSKTELNNELRHYFATKDGSYIYTQDRNVVTQIKDSRYYGETTYNVVEAGGDFEGYNGSFKSWGVFDFEQGTGVLRFEGKICKGEN